MDQAMPSLRTCICKRLRWGKKCYPRHVLAYQEKLWKTGKGDDACQGNANNIAYLRAVAANPDERYRCNAGVLS